MNKTNLLSGFSGVLIGLAIGLLLFYASMGGLFGCLEDLGFTVETFIQKYCELRGM